MNKELLCALFCVCSMGLCALVGSGTSGPAGTDNVDPTLTILSPTGGEYWFIGDTYSILYTAFDYMFNSESATVWYSTDGGASYVTLMEVSPVSGVCPWPIPNIPTQNAKVKVRVKDYFGNSAEKTSLQPFTLGLADPAKPIVLDISIADSRHINIDWQAVTEAVNGFPLVPDGYLVFASTNPSADESQFVFLGDVGAQTSFTHQNVARRAKKTFYRIVAYIDVEGRVADIIATAKSDTQSKLSLADLKAILSNGRGDAK